MRRAEAGFTLLEVVAALAVVALASVALLSSLSTGRLSTERARDAAREAAMLQTVLERLGTALPIRPGLTEGTESGLAWRVEITPYQDTPPPEDAPPEPLRLFQVGITVREPGSPGLAVTTLRATP